MECLHTKQIFIDPTTLHECYATIIESMLINMYRTYVNVYRALRCKVTIPIYKHLMYTLQSKVPTFVTYVY